MNYKTITVPIRSTRGLERLQTPNGPYRERSKSDGVWDKWSEWKSSQTCEDPYANALQEKRSMVFLAFAASVITAGKISLLQTF
jgi:hypothetical protein